MYNNRTFILFQPYLLRNVARGLFLITGYHNHPDTSLLAFLNGRFDIRPRRVQQGDKPDKCQVLVGITFGSIAVAVSQAYDSKPVFRHATIDRSPVFAFFIIKIPASVGCQYGTAVLP